MSHVFNLPELDDFTEKINMDELYEKKQQHDLSKLNIFNKILNRIHNKIKITARQKVDEQHCWFLIPEIMIGIPKYDNAACIAYVHEKLRDNGFYVKYYHPNLLFISWKNWIPGYVRTEIKKKMGVNLDGHGNVVDESDKNKNNNEQNNDNTNNLMFNTNKKSEQIENKQSFKQIKEYKPSGNFIYNQEIFRNIENKFK
tara:strand:- start:2923 stop:3519 length:597 start_codon:yes stop_codon:yes gene_type:complete